MIPINEKEGLNEGIALQNEDILKIDTLYKPFGDKIGELLIKAKNKGLEVNILEGIRTFQRQEKLYRQGRTEAGKIVTWALLSYHCFGLAVDIVFKKNGQWTWQGNFDLLGKLGKEIGLEWGGDFRQIKDSPHFQLSYGQKPQILKEIYDKRLSMNDVFEYMDKVKV